MEAKGNKPKAIREHLIKVARDNGMNREDEALINNLLKDNDFIKSSISEATNRTFNELRICGFTTDKNNLLFWSHYANSHKGICIEFDAAIMPIALAYKVEYSEKYPQVTYPIFPDERAFKPALVKAKVWGYENECRTMFIPTMIELPSDGESLFYIPVL